MKLQKVALVLMGMMLLFAGRSSAQDVKTDYDRNSNFPESAVAGHILQRLRRRLALGRIWRRHYNHRELQSRDSRRRPLRYKHKETSVARLGQRHAFQ